MNKPLSALQAKLTALSRAAEREASRVRVEEMSKALTLADAELRYAYKARAAAVFPHREDEVTANWIRNSIALSAIAALNPRAACPPPSHEGDAGKE